MNDSATAQGDALFFDNPIFSPSETV